MSYETKIGKTAGEIMIPIKKGNPPEELLTLMVDARRQLLSPKESYALLRGALKDEVRQCLLEEQGQLCAYCMARIPEKGANGYLRPVRIEHVFPRSPKSGQNSSQGLDYSNMCAVCCGNECSGNVGERRCGTEPSQQDRELTCDAHKGNVELRKVNPFDAASLTSIWYHADGRIDATDEDVRCDLQKTLNLNALTSPLLSARKRVMDEIDRFIGEQTELTPDATCRMLLAAYEAETNPKTPFVGVAIWYLRQFLSDEV